METLDLTRSYSGSDCLITGGLGFIGSNLARRLVDLGAKVTVLDSMIPDYGGNLFNIEDIRDRITVNLSDVRNRPAMDYLVRGRDYLFNLAGQVSHIDSMRDPFTDLDINCTSQLSLLESCRHHNQAVRIVFACSRQVYGRPEYTPVDERHPVHPVDVNGINKVAGEQYHILYHEVYGIRTTSLRLTNTYGPRQLVKHNRQGFIGTFVRTIVEGGEIQLYGDGSQVRDLNYVDDVVDAFLRAAVAEHAGGEVFNLSGDPPVSLKQISELLIQIAGRGSYRLVPFPEEKKRIDIGSYRGTSEKIRTRLGWQPRISLEDGLTRMIRYYEQNLRHYL